jgi:hypothetical protein
MCFPNCDDYCLRKSNSTVVNSLVKFNEVCEVVIDEAVVKQVT